MVLNKWYINQFFYLWSSLLISVVRFLDWLHKWFLWWSLEQLFEWSFDNLFKQSNEGLITIIYLYDVFLLPVGCFIGLSAPTQVAQCSSPLIELHDLNWVYFYICRCVENIPKEKIIWAISLLMTSNKAGLKWCK